MRADVASSRFEKLPVCSSRKMPSLLRSDPDSLATAGRSLVRISNFLTVGVAIILILIFSAAEWRKLYIPRYGANK